MHFWSVLGSEGQTHFVPRLRRWVYSYTGYKDVQSTVVGSLLSYLLGVGGGGVVVASLLSKELLSVGKQPLMTDE